MKKFWRFLVIGAACAALCALTVSLFPAFRKDDKEDVKDDALEIVDLEAEWNKQTPTTVSEGDLFDAVMNYNSDASGIFRYADMVEGMNVRIVFESDELSDDPTYSPWSFYSGLKKNYTISAGVSNGVYTDDSIYTVTDSEIVLFYSVGRWSGTAEHDLYVYSVADESTETYKVGKFNLGDKEYEYLHGMSFASWVSSSYNTDGWRFVGRSLINKDGTQSCSIWTGDLIYTGIDYKVEDHTHLIVFKFDGSSYFCESGKTLLEFWQENFGYSNGYGDESGIYSDDTENATALTLNGSKVSGTHVIVEGDAFTWG